MPRHFLLDTHRPATGVYAMCGVVAGVALQLQQSQLWSAAAYIALGLGAAAVMAWLTWHPRRRGWRKERWLWCLLAAAVAGSLTGWRATSMHAQRMPAQWEGQDVRMRALITQMPQPLERGVRLRVQVEQAWPAAAVEGAATIALPPHIALTWYGPVPAQGLRAGQRWEWTVRLKAPHGERNPHGMDWELWQWSQGIQATGYIRQSASQAPPQWLAQTWHAPVAQLRGALHQAMQVSEGADIDARQRASAGVVQALVTGAQSSISRADWQLFRDTGIAHLVSISGLHITMFAWLAIRVVNAVWRRSAWCCLRCPAPLAAAWVGWALAAAYAVFSGWGIPAQRTVGMLAMVMLMRHTGRSWPWPYVWLSILTAVVLLDPWSLLQAGFWLSFVAVGVLFAAQPLAMAATPQRLPMRMRHQLYQLLREQSVVTLALAPLTLLLFGQISVVGILANLWAIPWVTLVITPLSMLGALYPPLWTLAAHGVSAMVALLGHMAAWPMAVLYFAQPPWWAAAAGVLACLWLAMPWKMRWRLAAVPALLPMLLWVPPTPAWGHVEMLALDVGQGSAVLLRTQAHSLLFDAGPRWSAHADAGERTVVPLLRAWGVQPDAMMISHADSDHAGGADAVQQAYPHMQWWGAGGRACARGQTWQWDGVRFEVLHPTAASTKHPPQSTNANSCVLQVQSHTGARILLTGDIGVEQEHALLQSGSDVRADVLLVPHHGSTTSSSAAFIAQVQPRFAVVQAGYLNRYGHPAERVVQRYIQAGATVIATPACGAALWRSMHPTQMQCERATSRKYWAHMPP